MSDFSFNNMGSLKRERGSRRGPAPLNLPVRVQTINVANPKAPTPAVDTVVGKIAVDAWGMEAGSEITIRLAERAPPKKKDEAPLEIWNLQPGKSKGGRTMGEGPLVIFENAELQADGTVVAKWINMAEYKFSEEYTGDAFIPGNVSVGYVNKSEKGFISQNRHVHFESAAQNITGRGEQAIAQFREQAIALLSDNRDQAGGRPGVVIRIVNNDGIGQKADAVGVSTMTRWYSKDVGDIRSAEETVDAWMQSDIGQMFVNDYIVYADDIAEQRGTIEMWPFWNYNTGKTTSDYEYDNQQEGKHTRAESFSAPRINLLGELQVNDKGVPRTEYGLITSGMMQVVQSKKDGVPVNDWFANETLPLERYPSSFHSISDLPTQNLPESTVEYFKELARKRVNLKREMRKDATASHSKEESQDFGGDNAPDPTGGLKPRM